MHLDSLIQNKDSSLPFFISYKILSNKVHYMTEFAYKV